MPTYPEKIMKVLPIFRNVALRDTRHPPPFATPHKTKQTNKQNPKQQQQQRQQKQLCYRQWSTTFPIVPRVIHF